MIWIYCVIIIALLAVLAQMLLLLQKRSNEMNLRQDPLRRRIEFHHNEMETNFSTIEAAVVRSREEIRFSLIHLKKQRDVLGQAVGQLQNQISADETEEQSEEHGKEEAVMEEVAAVRGEPIQHTLLRETRGRYEEIDGIIGELEQDESYIRRNMERIEVKMRRKSSAELQEGASKKEGDDGPEDDDGPENDEGAEGDESAKDGEV